MVDETTPKQELLTGEPVVLEEALHTLVDEDSLYIFGHGTPTAEMAQGCVREGLHLKSPHLWSTVIGLPSTIENPEAFSESAALIRAWPHHNNRYVVVLGIERIVEDIPHRKYLQSVVQEREGADTDNPYALEYAINPRFIAGYFDIEADEFLPSLNFDPHYDPALLETTADVELESERNPVSMLELLGQAMAESAGEGPIEVPKPTPEDYDGPLVW